jgi:hypothetical protein
MRVTRFAAIALSATALAAVSTPFAARAATANQAALVTPAPSVAVYDCSNQPQVRPATFDFFCDGSGSFTKLRWSTWNASAAAATRVQYVDNCTPSCAQGTWSHRTLRPARSRANSDPWLDGRWSEPGAEPIRFGEAAARSGCLG